jgi:hypothetical protein
MSKIIARYLPVPGEELKHGDKYKVGDSHLKTYHSRDLECYEDKLFGAVKHKLFAVKEEIIGEIHGNVVPINEGDELQGDVDVVSVPLSNKGEVIQSIFIPTNK